jgi:hypothetical protein
VGISHFHACYTWAIQPTGLMFDRPDLKCPSAASVHTYMYLESCEQLCIYLFILFNSHLFDDAVHIQDYIPLNGKMTRE